MPWVPSMSGVSCLSILTADLCLLAFTFLFSKANFHSPYHRSASLYFLHITLTKCIFMTFLKTSTQEILFCEVLNFMFERTSLLICLILKKLRKRSKLNNRVKLRTHCLLKCNYSTYYSVAIMIDFLQDSYCLFTDRQPFAYGGLIKLVIYCVKGSSLCFLSMNIGVRFSVCLFVLQ